MSVSALCRALALEDSDALQAADQAWLDGIQPVHRQRILTHFGLHALEADALDGLARHAGAQTNPELVALLHAIEDAWPAVEPRHAALLLRHVPHAPWVSLPPGSPPAVHLRALVASLRTLPSTACDAAWCASDGATDEEAARRLACLRTRACRVLEDAVRALTPARAYALPPTLRRAWYRTRCEDPAEAASGAVLMDRVRRAWWDALAGASPLPHLGPMLDTDAEGGPLHEAACPLLLARPPAALLAWMLQPHRAPLPAAALLAAWAAAEAQGPTAADDFWDFMPWHATGQPLPAGRPPGLRPAAAGLDPQGLLQRCLALVPEALLAMPRRDALVERAADLTGHRPWTLGVRLALDPGVAAEVDDLLSLDTDWSDFDAPGEGTLPLFWASVLAVGGQLDEARADRLAALDPAIEARREAAAAAPDDLSVWVQDWVSPRACARAAGATGLMDGPSTGAAGFEHGLRDGIAEAFGDVWSPRDPFSQRSRPA
jgi:hypothetical protein